MPITLTPEQENRVNQKVASGQFDSIEEVIEAALHLVEESFDKEPLTLEELRQELAVADAQFERGKYRTYDRTALPMLLEEITEKGRQKLATQQQSEIA